MFRAVLKLSWRPFDVSSEGPHERFLVTTSGGCKFWFQSATKGDGGTQTGDQFFVEVLKVECRK